MVGIKRGAFIVIEGVDRSGKSTQCKNLVNALNKRNIKSELMNFPNRTTLTGKLIDEYLKNSSCQLNDQAIHLLFSANRWESVDKIKSLLYDGVTIVVDRYSYSGMAFSAVKNNMDLDWCKQPENGLPKPDVVFLLTLSPEELENRPGFGIERYENVITQRKVSDMFNKLSQEDDNWTVIDASGTIEEVHNNIQAKVLNTVEEVKMLPLKFLNLNKTV